MKRIMLLLLAASLLTGCAGNLGEERAFAVVLGIGETNGVWEACARIPAYQTGGGYITIAARGNTLGEALALLNASAPMELHYGQLRMLLMTKELAQSEKFPGVLRILSERGEIRAQAALCVTGDPLMDIMDALEPATGSRLSKSLESLLMSRQALGVLPGTTLSETQRMGEREQPVLISAALVPDMNETSPGTDEEAGSLAAKEAGKVQFSGGWTVGRNGQVQGSLSPMEMQLLSLLKGRIKQGTFSLPEGTWTLLDASSRVQLEGMEIHCRLKVRYSAADMTEEGLQSALINNLQALTQKLAGANCDALGLARKKIRTCLTMEEWHAQKWPEQYPAMTWRFTVQTERET